MITVWKVVSWVLFIIAFPFLVIGSWLCEFSNRADEKAKFNRIKSTPKEDKHG